MHDTPTSSALPEWEGPAIALMDLDAFFASVEMLDHPEWRGKPVIVGGSAERRGVVSTASYEARKYGVHSAMPSAQAERLCPDAIWVHGNFARYREVSTQVMRVILDETPLIEQVSIDEAFFDISPGRFSRENPIEICRRIQKRVDEIGVTCSIGLGSNKTVAKIASDRDKPHGLTVVYPGTAAEFLAPLPVRDMSGIGAAAEARLKELGIRTLGELAQADEATMAKHFGVSGPRMVRRAAALEVSRVSPFDTPEDVKSVSNERTFARDLSGRDEVESAIAHVCTLVGRRLRKKGLAGRCVTLKIKPDATHIRTAQTHLPRAMDTEDDFRPHALRLLDEIWDEDTPVRLVGVSMSEFHAAAPDQLDLFEDEDEIRERRQLARTMDEIAEKFGGDAVSRGRDMRLKGDISDTVPQNK